MVALAAMAAAGFFLINIVNPNMGATAEADMQFAHVTDRFAGQQTQALDVVDVAQVTIDRDTYSSTAKPTQAPKPKPTATAAAKSVAAAPNAPAPDPGSAQAYAQGVLASRGMGDDQFSCLVSLWNRESHWNVHAGNQVSGAYGIPQALPGSKMASAGPDWQDNYQTQVNWGLGYITGRYGTPCGAWTHSQSSGWY